jgi:hypothetical protein
LRIAIIRNVGAVHLAAPILAADGILQRFVLALGLYRRENLRFFRAHRMRVEFRRRFHCDQRQQLEKMVRHHVTQRAGRVVKAAAMADDPDLLIDGDLHMVDVIAVPDRLEHAVGKTQHQDVLHRLFAEIMIDPVNLVFADDLEQFIVEGFGGSKVGAEWLLHDQPPPCASLFPQHAGAAELCCDRSEGGRRNGEIEQAIAADCSVCFQPLEPFAHGVEGGRLVWVRLDAGDA